MLRLLLLLFVLISFPVHAAIVDVQDQFFSNPETNAFSVFDLDLAGASGNKDEKSFTFATHNILRRGPSTLLFVAQLANSEVNNVENANNRFAHLRYTRDLAGYHGVEVLAQYSEDKFANLASRDVYGGGYRYQWIRGSSTQRGLMGLGIIREIEQYVGQPGERKRWRANLYMTVARPFDEARHSSIGLTTYLQPAIAGGSDVRGIAALTFKSALTERLQINIGINYNYESKPSPGLSNYSLSYSSGFSYTFR